MLVKELVLKILNFYEDLAMDENENDAVFIKDTMSHILLYYKNDLTNQDMVYMYLDQLLYNFRSNNSIPQDEKMWTDIIDEEEEILEIIGDANCICDFSETINQLFMDHYKPSKSNLKVIKGDKKASKCKKDKKTVLKVIDVEKEDPQKE